MLAQIRVSIASSNGHLDDDKICLGRNEGWQQAFASVAGGSKSSLEQKSKNPLRVMTY